MTLARTIPVTFLALCLAGCVDNLGPKFQLAAKPLRPLNELNIPSGASNSDIVNSMVQDSQAKCADFVNSMFAQTSDADFGLDALETITSALGTVFTPIAVTHSLSAASAVIGGVKSSISADYLNSVAINNITQAIQSTYGADMKSYIAWLDTKPVAIDVQTERSRLESYHNQCSLSAAEGSIGSTLQPSPPQTPSTTPASGGSPPLLGAARRMFGNSLPPQTSASPPPAGVSGASIPH
jgi:hypothetical protein